MKVPWLPRETIEGEASKVLSGYGSMIGRPLSPPIPVEDIIERYFGLRLSFEDLEQRLGRKDILGATFVRERRIVIHRGLLDDHPEGRMLFTCAHEAGHWVLHREFVDEAERGAVRRSIICRTADARKPVEWQADYFAACLLMPKDALKEAFLQVCGCERLEILNEKNSYPPNPLCFEPSAANWPLIASAVCRAGGFVNVSKEAMIIRLQQLGMLVNATGGDLRWLNRTIN